VVVAETSRLPAVRLAATGPARGRNSGKLEPSLAGTHREADAVGERKADGLKALLDSIAQMAPEDRALAERVHMAVTAAAPELFAKTWYGMPAYANAEGKIVVFFKDAGKFKYRYSTLGFEDAASLDDGDLWPVSYALQG